MISRILIKVLSCTGGTALVLGLLTHVVVHRNDIPIVPFDAVKKEALKYALKDAVYVVMCFVPIALAVLGLIIGLASLFK